MKPMIFDLALVTDRGSYWNVENLMKNTLEATADKGEKVLKLSYITGKRINDAILANKRVKISKTLISNEVMPWEIEVVDYAEDDTLQDARDAATVKIRMLVTPEITKIAGLTLYGFIVLNNDLVNAGYAITNENREEKYLEILETGDEKLIAKLEDYLNYKDEIEAASHLERKFAAFRQEIKSATTIELIAEIETRFLDSYYRTY